MRLVVHLLVNISLHQLTSSLELTHQAFVRTQTAQESPKTVFFSITLQPLSNADNPLTFLVYSDENGRNGTLYCHDDERNTFLAIDIDRLTIISGVHFMSFTLIDIHCVSNLCSLYETKVTLDDIYGRNITRFDKDRSKRSEDMNDDSSTTTRMFYVTLSILIDSGVISEFCQRLYPNCCRVYINTKNLCHEIRDYYLNMLNAVHRLYSDIDNDQMSINTTVVAMYVIPQRAGRSVFDYFLKAEGNVKYLDVDRAIVYAASLSDRIEQWYGYEIAASLVFVAQNMEGTLGSSTVGAAYAKSVCLPNNVGIIEERLGYVTFFTVIHELGHILGSEHDGLFSDCGSTEDMLMGWSLNKKKSELAFIFSCCSLAQMYEVLKLSRCVYRSFEGDLTSLSKESDKFLGELITHDQYCQLTVGDKYRACPAKKLNPNRYDQCKGVVCVDTTDNKCYLFQGIPALNGMKCRDSQHWCMYGNCIVRTAPFQLRNGQQRACNVTRPPRQRIDSKNDESFDEKYGG